MPVLVTYAFNHRDGRPASFHYDIAASATAWIEEMEAEAHEDGTYVLVHVLSITDTQAQRYDGALQSM